VYVPNNDDEDEEEEEGEVFYGIKGHKRIGKFCQTGLT
jgi:hypothetical protein